MLAVAMFYIIILFYLYMIPLSGGSQLFTGGGGSFSPNTDSKRASQVYQGVIFLPKQTQGLAVSSHEGGHVFPIQRVSDD